MFRRPYLTGVLVILAGFIVGTFIGYAAWYPLRLKSKTDSSTPGQHNVWLHVDASCVAISTTDANGIEQLSYIQCGGHK